MDIKQIIVEKRLANDSVNLSCPHVFEENMRLIHSIIVASEDLLKTAIENSSGELKAYYENHLEEERNHAAWLREDISISQNDSVPLVSAMVGTQYYLAKHFSPYSLLGYIASLEVVPMPLDRLEVLEAIHGNEKCRTLRYHAEHDIEHGSDVINFINTLDEEKQEIVLDSLTQTEAYIAGIAHYLGGLNHG